VAAHWDLSPVAAEERAAERVRLDAALRSIAARLPPGQRLSEALPGGARLVAHALNAAGLAAVAVVATEYPIRSAFGVLEQLLSSFGATFGESWRLEAADTPLGDALAAAAVAAVTPAAATAAARTSPLGLPPPPPPAVAQPAPAPPPLAPPLGWLPPAGRARATAAAPAAADVRELMACARHGRYKEAKSLLKSEGFAASDGTYGVDTCDEYGNTALMVACQVRHGWRCGRRRGMAQH
jgi:hypothetical protein